MTDFPKPKKPVRAYTVHELRGVVTARHKVLLANGKDEDGLALMREHYGATDDSTRDFLAWLRGETIPDGKGGSVKVQKNGSVDRFHVGTDMKTGDDYEVDSVPGSIPPRPSPKPPKR